MSNHFKIIGQSNAANETKFQAKTPQVWLEYIAGVSINVSNHSGHEHHPATVNVATYANVLPPKSGRGLVLLLLMHLLST